MLKATTSIINASQIATPITLPGNVTLSTGNLVIGTAGKGIDFSATSHPAGMTSELLADYEEGTWTPGQGGGVTVVGTYSSSGTYTKIGRNVTVQFKVSGSTSIAVTSGSSFVTGLPFSGIAGLWFVGSSVNNSGTLSTNPFVLEAAIYSAEAIGATADIWGTFTFMV